MSLNDFVRFLVSAEPWQEHAACKDEPLDTFFPMRGQSKKRAYAICSACPVKRECRDYAERSGTDHGIWGGEIRNAHRDEPARRLTA